MPGEYRREHYFYHRQSATPWVPLERLPRRQPLWPYAVLGAVIIFVFGIMVLT